MDIDRGMDAITIIDDLKTLLSNPKPDSQQLQITKAIRQLILLSSSCDGPSQGRPLDGKSGCLPKEGPSLELLNSDYVQETFYESIISIFMPAEDEISARKEKLPTLHKNKVLIIKLMKEWSPHVNRKAILSRMEASLKSKNNLVLLLGLLMQNCISKDDWNTTLLRILQFTNNSDISSVAHRSFITALLAIEQSSLLFEAISTDAEAFRASAAKICNWLISTPSKNPKTPLQMKSMPEKRSAVEELDGSPSRDFFTVLSITHSYNSSQLNNIHTFSMLRNFLNVMQQYDVDTWSFVMKKISSESRAMTAMARVGSKSSFYLASSASSGSSDRLSICSSVSSLHSFQFVEHEGDKNQLLDDSLLETGSRTDSPPSHHASMQSLISQDLSPRPVSVSTPRASTSLDRSRFSSASLASLSPAGGLTLKSASVKYCIRILSQAEKVPRKVSDRETLVASVIEAVRILTLLCHQDDLLVNKVFPEIKRVNSRILGNSKAGRRLYPADIQFFIEHYEGMNAKEPIDAYLRTVPSQLYTSSSACFEVLDFCLRNRSFFERYPCFLEKFYPNVLKIAAWHPRTFLYEFLELMPIIVSESTAVELFHAIIDIPCTAALLELSQQNHLDRFLEENLESSTSDQLSFLSKSHRFISDFFTRCESGGPETIDKLDKVYDCLKPLSTRTRINVCAQMVPILLQKFFHCVYALKCQHVLELLMPSILERAFVLHQSDAFQMEIRRVLSAQIMTICSSLPSIISLQQDDFLAVFKQIRRSGAGLESIISSVVYCIGEFSIRTSICTSEQIAKFYETVETLLYETRTSLFNMDDFFISAEVISSLISTAGKLAACSQDFVPKTVLCLTKLASHKWKMNKCRLSQHDFEIVMTRAIEVINLLRLPDVSPSVLCSGHDVSPWNTDKNASMLLRVQAMARTDKGSS